MAILPTDLLEIYWDVWRLAAVLGTVDGLPDSTLPSEFIDAASFFFDEMKVARLLLFDLNDPF